MSITLDRLGSHNFEFMIQALVQDMIGIDVKIYGDGSDGQREAFVQSGTILLGGKEYHGKLLFQAKYKSADGKEKDWNWLRRNLIDELEGLKKMAESDHSSLPDVWCFFTNVILTPVKDTGIKDKTDELISKYTELIPHIVICGADEIERLLDNNIDVRTRYSEFLTAGDVLQKVIDYVSEQQQRDHPDTLVTDRGEKLTGTVDPIEEQSDVYLKSWNNGMFLESLSTASGKQLKEVYVLPYYQYYEFPKGKGQDVKLSAVKKDLSQRLHSLLEQRDGIHIIFGAPGIGKSTLMTWMVAQCNTEKHMEIYRFSDMETVIWELQKPEQMVDCIFQSINPDKTPLSVRFKNRVLLLDGFDEVNCREEKRLELLEYLHKRLAGICPVFITCRENYMNQMSRLSSYSLLRLCPFSDEQVRTFISNYTGNTFNEDELSNLLQQDESEENVYRVPVILYMCLALQIDLKKGDTITAVYERIFDKRGLLNRLVLEDGYSLHYDSERTEAELDQLCTISKAVALKMFSEDRLYCYGIELQEIFELCSDNDNLLQALSAGFFKLGHTEYNGKYEENEQEFSSITSLRFVHKSIYEYFLACILYDILEEFYTQYEVDSFEGDEALRKAADQLGRVLQEGSLYYVPKTAEHLIDKIRRNKLLVEKMQDMNPLETLFANMLEEGMVAYHPYPDPYWLPIVDPGLSFSTREIMEAVCFENMLSIIQLIRHIAYQGQRQDYYFGEQFLHISLEELFNSGGSSYATCLEKYLRMEHTVPLCLRGFDLSEINLSNLSLDDWDLQYTKLQSTDFTKSIISNAKVDLTELVDSARYDESVYVVHNDKAEYKPTRRIHSTESSYALSEREMKLPIRFSKDTICSFGRYPQGPNGEIKPLVWRVEKFEYDRVLLYADRILYEKSLLSLIRSNDDIMTLQNVFDILNENLNNEFRKEAFSSEEDSRILSLFFPSETDVSITNGPSPTEYLALHAETPVMEPLEKQDNWWWVCSMQFERFSKKTYHGITLAPYIVRCSTRGSENHVTTYIGFQPAMWLDISSVYHRNKKQ